MKKLLEPARIGKLELKNRVIYDAVGFASNGNYLPEAEVDSMVWRAKQKISPGLLITHGLEVWQRKGLIPTANLSSDDCMYELSRQVKKIQINGCKVCCQLSGRGTRLGLGDGAMNIGPSATRYAHDPNQHGNDKNEIFEYIGYYGDAARRAKDAGFDAVEIHACTGKLVSSFLSPYGKPSNRRIRR